MTSPQALLTSYRAEHEFLVCIDSDGCAFDTMGIKQRECFCPWMVSHFGLQPVAEAARECKEFADLFSKTRGANRHVTIKRILTELLPSHPLVKRRGFQVPQYPAYFDWIEDSASLLSNEGLSVAIARETDPEAKQELESVLAWSERVNWAVGQVVRGIPPFPGVRETLDRIVDRADIVVVSATPLEALLREWAEHNIADQTRLICGQEMGSKRTHIEVVGAGYERDRVLMIGDAPGDLRSAEANGVLFYPIIPGQEEDAWAELLHEGIERFFEGTYRGPYADRLLEAFDAALPESPPWKGAT